MYQSPDFIKLDLNIKDDFAAYPSEGCKPDGYWMDLRIDDVVRCTETSEHIIVMGAIPSFQCYSNLDP